MLRFFSGQCATLPDEMLIVAGLFTPPTATKLAAMLATHFGAPRKPKLRSNRSSSDRRQSMRSGRSRIARSTPARPGLPEAR